MEDLAALKSFCWPNSNLWSRSRGRRSEEGEAEPPPPRHAVVPCVPRNEASWSIARPTGKASKEAALLTRIRTPPDGECGASSGVGFLFAGRSLLGGSWIAPLLRLELDTCGLGGKSNSCKWSALWARFPRQIGFASTALVFSLSARL